ncbi:Hyaluronan synthase [Pseudodesulfovibrio hydrargyri]|uniref:Hyaluronan synthase n=1 Tax=Pseudodesulfovibrio hydrargyri TaxID=2125990 RepID=A0A1J5MRB9_9BACT|nr:glycosyltransferase family 2 protein [Pseudodesulfovibrio hydrargyri]OIQ49142.1 Hyaluronan synthase [Pseudodesulfovibrio hydrargyri]
MAVAANEEVMVSVVIPTYNRAGLIGKALESVLRQSYGKYEIIVVDDGSVDDTKAVVTGNYPQARYIYKDNGGAASARNIGISEARGELVAFLDADDAWYESKLEKQVEVMAADTGIPLCFTDWREVKDGRVWHESGVHWGRGFRPDGDYVYHNMVNGFKMLPSCTMVRKDLLVKHGLFNEELPICEDWDLFLKISTEGDVAYIDTPLLDRHLEDDRLTAKRAIWMRASVTIIEDHLRLISSGRLVVGDSRAAWETLTQRLLQDGHTLAYILYTSGKGAEARNLLVRCMRIAKGTTKDAVILLLKTFIPYKIGHGMKYILLGKWLKND